MITFIINTGIMLGWVWVAAFAITVWREGRGR